MCRVYKDTMWKSISTWYRPTSRTPIINVTSVKTKLLQWVWNLVFKRHRIEEARVVDVYKAGCRIRGATPSPPTRRPLTCEPHIKICQKTEKTQFTAAADASLCFQPLSTFVWSLSVCAKPIVSTWDWSCAALLLLRNGLSIDGTQWWLPCPQLMAEFLHFQCASVPVPQMVQWAEAPIERCIGCGFST